MSLIRAIKHRLGLSVTPANNFVLDASADNGTMKLARESGQDIMTVDAAGKVAFPQQTQTLQNFTSAGRVLGTTYTNDTNQTIIVMATATSTTATAGCTATIDGIDFSGAIVTTAGFGSSVAFAVPPATTYSVRMTGTATLTKWLEVR